MRDINHRSTLDDFRFSTVTIAACQAYSSTIAPSYVRGYIIHISVKQRQRRSRVSAGGIALIIERTTHTRFPWIKKKGGKPMARVNNEPFKLLSIVAPYDAFVS